MSVTAIQAARYNMALRRRGRQFADALTVHKAGLTVVGADQFNGMLTSGAMFVQSETTPGQPWAALTSGTTGGTPLTGNGVINDGGVTWVQWSGLIRSAPPTP
jgi:hypothetical protein